MRLLMKIIDSILSLIYPRRCISCNEILSIGQEWLCDKCAPGFEKTEHRRCKICGRIVYHNGNCRTCNSNKLYFDNGYSVFEYKGNVRNGIRNFKYKGLYSYGRYFGKIMSDYAKCNMDIKFDYVTAVPLHRKRLSDRGYNQSKILAKFVAKSINVEYKDLLIRKVNTIPLNSLGRKERMENIKGAFAINPNVSVENKYILIIDDIYTTGSTINECCKVLKKNHAAMVEFFTLSCTSED